MLIKDFYRIVSIQSVETDFQATIELNKDHAVFDGHFPDNPVMPGVCMIQIIKELVETTTNKRLFMQTVSNVKFMTLINPQVDQTLLVNFTVEEKEELLKVKSSISFQDTLALKMSSVYTQK
ncbi:3-hydroxyacyl-ACP dehydratase [Myroides sp. C15-4]|uniref:3-hydroxyacyl-ACP dehydratase n=1 Tax=Myroides sp. C15-4 TaxID=3400532 RepID=UPI003D2F7588